MKIYKTLAIATTSLALAGLPAVAMAQSTAKENNATSGSEPGAGPKSQLKDKNDMGASSKTMGDMKEGDKTSAGTSENQAKDLRGHSETPSTGAK